MYCEVTVFLQLRHAVSQHKVQLLALQAQHQILGPARLAFQLNGALTCHGRLQQVIGNQFVNGSRYAGAQGQGALGRIQPEGFCKLTSQGENVIGVTENQPAKVRKNKLASFPRK